MTFFEVVSRSRGPAEPYRSPTECEEQQMKRRFLNLLWVSSLIGCAAICLLWMRSTSGVDSASLTYNRYLANGRAASNEVYLTSDSRLWINIIAGSVAPYDGQLVWGYHVSADMSKGKPRFRYDRSPYATNVFVGDGRVPTNDSAMSGWGPLRWQDFRRSSNGEQFRSITFGVSHWAILILFLLLPSYRIYLLRRSTRTNATKANGEQWVATERATERFGNGCSIAPAR
ncbi:hypothetical protein Poly24_13880 [Rosistilla carotiformis]|uniref:Uncharacterized protein n=1 Tax=Rosistilla carotiformis TaxID=2528017 RepID=A0A518JQ79_9BACT|nr:hypothetical protein Poly24_13880 [Rosistilla carotiformis]